MTHNTLGTCKSCGAAVRWVVMVASGKAMPLDADPHPEGNVEVAPAGASVLGREAAEDARRHDLPLYRSHFATCVDAAKHRRR